MTVVNFRIEPGERITCTGVDQGVEGCRCVSQQHRGHEMGSLLLLQELLVHPLQGQPYSHV